MPPIALTCRACGQSFEFREHEQQKFEARGWSVPSCCGACRDARRRREEAQGARALNCFSAFDRRRRQ
jgi:putative zinc ribbon protein